MAASKHPRSQWTRQPGAVQDMHKPRLRGKPKSDEEDRGYFEGSGYVLRFLGTLFLGLIIFYLGYSYISATQQLEGLLQLIATTTSAMLDGMGFAVMTRGTVIHSSGMTLQIAKGCDGLEPIGFLVCAALATPTRFRARIFFAIIGAACLVVLNVFRIISIVIVADYDPQLAMVAHWNVWPALIIVFIVLSWVAWLRRIQRMDHELT